MSSVPHIEQWVGFDLDGTVAKYDRWRGDDHIGKPIDLMVRRIQSYIARGYVCKIFTARVAPMEGRDVDKIRRLIQDYCEAHIGHRLAVTCIKDQGMIQHFDDRCVQVIKNTGKIVITKKEKGRK
jgi:hypothetical protein